MKQSEFQGKRQWLAHLLPMLAFALLFALNNSLKTPAGSLWQRSPELLIYPLQTLLCGALLLVFWHHYNFRSFRRPLFAGAIALTVFVFWIAPQQFFHAPARLTGFNPNTLDAHPTLFWLSLALRFLRLVLVVPLVEEIFWRSFLLRYLISERFYDVPFGAFSWLSSTLTALAFALSHSRPDWPAALIAGALYNLLAHRTGSLTSCVVAHSLTNLALGLWIVSTGQWGFW